MISRAATPDDRLRMLRDCGVVRSDPSDSTFDVLWNQGLVMPLFRRSVGDKINWALTRDGKTAAMRLPPFA